MKLTRPLVMIDFEATEVDTQKARIVQLAAIKLQPDGSREVKKYLVNPGIPIPEASTEIHRITDEMVKYAKTFRELAPGLYSFIMGCDLGGFNSSNYDFPLLYEEFKRVGIDWDYSQHFFVDAFTIYRHFYKRNLAAAVKDYLKRELVDAHDAEVDITATLDVFEAQVDSHSELPDTIEEIDLFCNEGKKRLDLSGFFYQSGEFVMFAKGKHKGKYAAGEFGYIKWMLQQDFPSDTKRICTELLQRIRR